MLLKIRRNINFNFEETVRVGMEMLHPKADVMLINH